MAPSLIDPNRHPTPAEAEQQFANDLDAAITRAKAGGADLGEMIAELEGVTEGLRDEVT